MVDRLNSDFIEKIILKGMINDKDFLVLVSSVFEGEYFDDPNIAHVFKFSRDYVEEYKSIPSRDAVINAHESPDNIRAVYEEADSVQFDLADGHEFLINQANDYLKEKAIKQAIVESVEEVEDPEKRFSIQKRIEEAIIKDIKPQLGLDYFGDMRERLRRIFTASDNRIPTYFPVFDDLIQGGFPPFTFSVIIAKIHSGKSNLMANFGARQVLNGHNVVLLTLEMSQDAFAQRFDSIFTCLDINKIYCSHRYKQKLMRNLSDIKNIETRGNLFIKEYGTGNASIIDFRTYLRDLQLRGIDIDIVYVDYINLMKAAYKVENNLYSSIKRVSEELRSLSFEFKCPIISVSQLNREGFFIQFREVGFNHIAESIGIGATADFISILGTDENEMVYESEILYKITKSRIGGRVGNIDRFYIDNRSLKMYDASELDLWIEEATISGDARDHFERDDD